MNTVPHDTFFLKDERIYTDRGNQSYAGALKEAKKPHVSSLRERTKSGGGRIEARCRQPPRNLTYYKKGKRTDAEDGKQ